MEGERTVSPEVQEQQCRALPGVAGADEIEVFRDLDISGGKLRGRKGFLALVERIKTGNVDVVAAYDQSRAFRNTSDALDFYALMEKRADIEVVFVHGRFDRSPAGEFTYTTLAAAHAMERRMTGEKIRDAYRYATQRGQMVGQVPGGYVRHLDGSISIDDEVAPTIRRIFEMYATGRFTARDIARLFNAEGVPKLPRSRGAASALAQHRRDTPQRRLRRNGFLREPPPRGPWRPDSRRVASDREREPVASSSSRFGEAIRSRWAAVKELTRICISRSPTLLLRRAAAWRRQDPAHGHFLCVPARPGEAHPVPGALGSGG